MTDACENIRYLSAASFAGGKNGFRIARQSFKSLNVVTQAVMAEGKQNAVAVGYTKMSTEKMYVQFVVSLIIDANNVDVIKNLDHLIVFSI